MEIEGEMKNLSIVCLVIMVSLCYCNLVSGRLAKGKWRLISLLPIFYIFAIIPLYLTSAFLTEAVVFLITWLSNLKLLLFAFDQGPISSKSLPIFIATATLPFKLKPKTEAITPKKPKKLPLNLATEIPIFAVLISIYEYNEYIHPNVLLLCLIFLMIEIFVESSRLLARVFLGLELPPASDEPYLSTSLQDFWGRRWNLTVNSILREMIYKPVRSAAATAALGRDLAELVGVLAAFTVSGILHELLVWYVSRGSPSWEMTLFFVVHGVCVAMEIGLKKKMKKWGIAVPSYVSWPLTVGFLTATSYWLFCPPLFRNGVDVRVIQEFRFALELVKDKIVEFWLYLFA